MKKIIIYFLMIVLGSCKPLISDKDRSILVIPTPEAIEVLNPQKVVSLTNKYILRTIFSLLFELEGHSAATKIVKRWEYDPKNKTYYFRIKEDVFFHDGKRMNVDDVIFSIHQWARAGSLDAHLLDCIQGADSYRLKKNKNISGINRISDYKFSIQMKNSLVDLIQLLTIPRFAILPNNFNGKNENEFFKNPIGTGPFLVNYVKDSEASFSRFERYFQKPAKLKTIVFKKMSYQQSLEEFNKGSLDNLFFFSVENPNKIKRKDKIVQVLPSMGTVALVIPLNNEYSQEKINREDTAGLVYKELGKFSSCFENTSYQTQLLPPGLAQHDMLLIKKTTEIDSKSNNQKSLVIGITKDFWINCFDKNQSSVTIGRITLIPGELNELFEKFQKGELHYFLEDLMLKNADPMSILQYFEPGGGEYLLSKNIPKLKDMYTTLHASLNKEIQWKMTLKIVQYLADEKLVVPLYHPKNIRVYSDEIMNYNMIGIYQKNIDWENIGYKE